MNSSSARGSRSPAAGSSCGASTSCGAGCCAGEACRKTSCRPGAGRRTSNARRKPCHTGIRKPDASSSANATGGGRPNARRWAYVQNAAGETPRPGEVSARFASKEAGPPNAPDTRGPGLRERLMAGAVPRAAGSWRGRGAGSAGANAPKPGCARPAANESPWRAAPSARRAAKNAGRRNGSSTPTGRPPGDAVGAGLTSSTRLRRAPDATPGMQNAVRARTPRAGRAITTGAPSGSVLTAAPMRMQG